MVQERHYNCKLCTQVAATTTRSASHALLLDKKIFAEWLHILYMSRRKLRSCKFRYLFNINEGLGLLKLADTVLILINPSPSNIKENNWARSFQTMFYFSDKHLTNYLFIEIL